MVGKSDLVIGEGCVVEDANQKYSLGVPRQSNKATVTMYCSARSPRVLGRRQQSTKQNIQ